MAQVTLRKAKRSQVYLKMGISAPSGAGKTLGALLIAYGLMKEKHPNATPEELWNKIGVVDTENNSAELYSGLAIGTIVIGEYFVVPVNSPFTVDKAMSAMDLLEENGVEVCVLDSMTHYWSGSGGLLDKQGDAAKKSGNSYTAWKDVTPLHNMFVEKILQSHMHIIATMRSKTEYVQEKDSNGKTTVRKLGMNPIQRDGMEYEFTLFFDVDENHLARASKDRTSIFVDASGFKINPDTGRKIMQWLNSADTSASPVVAEKKTEGASNEDLSALKAQVKHMYDDANPEKQGKFSALFKKFHPSGNPNKITEEAKLLTLIEEMKGVQ